MKKRLRGSLALTLISVLALKAQEPPMVTLQPNDHVAIVGNTLAERMQHDGFFETRLHLAFPKHKLVVRNLGFSGDEVDHRIRSARFGTPDDWLKRVQANVVIACFGFGESFAGDAGLAHFEKKLAEYVDHLRTSDFGKGKVRVILVSPVFHENLGDPNLPDGSANNARLIKYVAAMKKVAAERKIPLVDLFAASFRHASVFPGRSLTFNGIHLNDRGASIMANEILKQGFGVDSQPSRLESKLREVVNDKSFFWFNRYRTVDGYSIYGERAFLKFVNGQTNFEVMQREMEILDQMTANRDERIWAVAQGSDRVVDDSNTKPFIPVITNKPGSGPNGAHTFLDPGSESISKMTLGKKLHINLFASEKEFPELAKPVQMAFDPKGRLWVAVMPSYPHWKPKDKMDDKILILEDTNADGKADRCTVFADGLHVPTGLELWNGGVFVGQQPDLMFLKDTDGDGKADVRQRVLHGLDSADTHHALNSFTLGPGGELYFQEGTFHHTQVETLRGVLRCANAGVYRYEPRTHRFDAYVSYPFANPHGHVFDRWGQDFITDGTSNQNYFAAGFSGHLEYPNKHPQMQTYFQQRVRPCAGTEILSSRHFPDDMQGNLLNANVIGFQGILQYRFQESGSGFTAEEVEPIVFSSDPNFRPADIEMGPDGAIYFLEWQNPIIGHMQHNLRDPSRDQTHGRVYRVTYEGRPLLEPKAIAGQPISKLLDLLKEPEDRVRHRVRIELSARESGEVITVTRQWLERLDSKDPEYEHHILEGLWVHQQHNQINVPLLKRVLASKDHRARAAATRVLCYWADRIPDSLEMLKQLAADSHPRVRLEAVWAASFFQVPEAVEIPAIAADYPMDYYLEYVKRETLRTLDPYLKSTLAANKKINVTSDAGARFLLSSVDLASLLKMERNRAVCMELLLRAGVPDADRLAGAESLARMEHRTVATVLMDAVQQFDRNSQTRNPLVLFDLVRMLGRRGEELKKVRQDIEKLATQGTNDLVRQLAMVALVAADGDAEPTWQLAQSSPSALRDFVSAIPNIGDPSARAGLYPKLIPLLRGFPSNMNVPKTAGAALGRFVRIELPGNRRTLTLAEVEVMSNGVNVARHGKAKQKNTSHGGNAARGIDGNKAGQFNRGGQTHTQENTANPWWEVDLGADVPIQSVHVYNRTDERLGQRLNGFSLVILDGNRQEVYRKDDIPAPPRSKEFPVSGSSPESLLRQAVMKALVSVRGKETETFKALVPFVTHGPDRASAAQAMQRISATHWPAEDLSSLVNATMEYLRKVPVAERTEPEPAEMIQLAYALATRLPRDRATAVRKELGDIGVRVIRLSTVPEQMIYDQDRLVMQAGKPVEILFDNPDLMPHNLVFVVPGALVEVGELAEKTGNDSTALDREYVPVSDKILSASRLLQPRQKLRMAFTPPNKPGVYPYVCTYPGHWRRMYGALYVVENLEEYLSSPEAYLTNHPMDIRDEMLKLNRPRKEWKLEELAAELTNLKGRSFGNGKQIFTVANCIACHRLNNVGTQFGPELDKLDPKLTPKDVLQSILEPSHKIDDKFATYSFPMDSGKVITGMIVGESPDVIKVIENPLASAKPTELPRGEVLGRKKSNVSLMPKGLLDKLTKEEILDLVAYVLAKGDAKHAVFQGSHDHGQANEHRKHDK